MLLSTHADWNFQQCWAHGCAWAERALGVLLPPRCVLCGAAGQPPALDLCLPCAGELPLNRPACARCAMPLELADADALCGACLRRPPHFDAAFCAWRYSYPVDHLVRALKYHGNVACARVLGERLAVLLRARPQPHWPEFLLPVPLAPLRFRQRGYNQALELGRWLERRLTIPLRADVLVRTRETREQAGLRRAERRKNLRAAFAVRRELRGTHVALIDDVITTASTLNELARTLKTAGVAKVEVWAAARAQGKRR